MFGFLYLLNMLGGLFIYMWFWMKIFKYLYTSVR